MSTGALVVFFKFSVRVEENPQTMVPSIPEFKSHIIEMKKRGAVSFPFLTEEECAPLIEEAKKLTYKTKKEYPGSHGVRQQFATSEIERGGSSLLSVFAEEFEEKIRLLYPTIDMFMFTPELSFSDICVQWYKADSIGITPHREGQSFRNLIAIILLSGSGTFYLCRNEKGEYAKALHTEPGWCILMRAPGFLGTDVQPYHYVSDIKEERLIIALRQKVKIADPAQS